MGRSVWERQIRPGFVIASIFVFVILRGSHFSSQEKKQDVPRTHQHPGVWRTEDFPSVDYESALVDEWDRRDEIVIRARHLLFSDSRDLTTVVGNAPLEEPQPFAGNETVAWRTSQSPACDNVKKHVGYLDSCAYVKANPECNSGTAVEYLQFFYCACSGAPILGYVGLALWLGSLFYMLGNTAADFFCCSLEKLSKLLHLPPTVAGVSLLPLGNGAPDVFASIAAFVGAGQGQVGLNSVLGGAVFVTSVVAGSVSLVVAGADGDRVHLDKNCFFRDIGFFCVTLASLCAVLFVGEIHLWGALAYISIYVIYAFTVGVVEVVKSQGRKHSWHALEPLLPAPESGFHHIVSEDSLDPHSGPFIDLGDTRMNAFSAVDTSLPQWMWAPHVAIYARQGSYDSTSTRPLWGWSEELEHVVWYSPRGLCLYLVEWPLTLPRRLTIPIVENARWSRSYAVASATLAPMLLGLVWDGKDNGPFGSSRKVYVLTGLLGAVLGTLALFTLKVERPPRRYLFPWVAGGFVMSIVWFYVIANELVAALVALGVIIEIDPAILGLTVLAWGNSIGDLMSNLALVCHGGDGVQIAFSGCYAGPMFNTLVGIGLSLVLASWKAYPASFTIPHDSSIFYTIGFLVAGLLWTLIVLPFRGMQPSKALGVGLLFLYCSFLMLRLQFALGGRSLAGVD